MGELKIVNCGDDPAKYSREELGGKALGLMDLFNIQDEFPFKVPPFFVIPTSFYRDYWERHGLGSKINIHSCEDINSMNRLERTYIPEIAPRGILNLFSSFARDYAKIINPAFFKLTEVSKKRKLVKEFRRKYHEFIKQISQRMDYEDYLGILDMYKEDTEHFPWFRKDHEQLPRIGDQVSTIYRSSHPLEDGKFSFAGVFDSAEDQPANRINQYPLLRVLAGAFEPYAQYYAEAHGIKYFNREMAVIIQQYISGFPDFAGQIHVLPKKTAIKYSAGQGHSINFWVETENNKITRYDRKDQKIRIHGSAPFSNDEGYIEVSPRRLDDDYLLFLADLSERVTKHFGQDAQNYEFVFNKGQLYFVQKRPDYVGSVLSEPRKPIKAVNDSKVITRDALGIFAGDFSGPFINVLKYSETKKIDYMDLKKLSLEELSEIDKKYPGAIYFVDTAQFFNVPGKGLPPHSIRGNPNLFHMLTPNKKGVILTPGHITGHMDVVYIEDRVYFCIIQNPKDLESIADGEIISVTTNGHEAIIYRP